MTPTFGSIVLAGFSLILIILALIGFLWIIIGSPLAIIFLIKLISSQAQDDKEKYLKKTLLSLAGWALLIGTFILWSITLIASSFFGVSNLSSLEPI